MRTETARAAAALLLLTAVWGYNWVALKIATESADAFSVGAIRSVVATLALFATLVLLRRPLAPTPVGATVVLGLLQTTGFTLFQTLAVASGGAGKTAVLAYTMPFWTVLLAWPFLGERVTVSGALALALAAAGLALVLAPLDFAHGLVSELCALAAAVSWGASAIYAKRFRARATVESLSLTAWQMLYGTVPLVIVAALVPHRYVYVDGRFLAAMAYIAVLGTALAWLLWLLVLKRLSAGAASISSLLTPVVGVAAAWLQLGERPNALELAGIACILAALAVNALPSRSPPAAGAEAVP